MKFTHHKKQIIICGLTICLLSSLCGCDFFVSPSELFTTPIVTEPAKDTPGAVSKPNPTATDIPVATNTTAPTSTSEPTASPTPTVSPTATPSPIPTVQPAPAALNTDINTYDFIVDRAYVLPDGYAPTDLVPLSECALDYDSLTDDKHKLRKVAAEALTEMFNKAKTEELTLVAVSGYRSYERQYQIYGNYLLTYSLSHTNRYSAMPGSSEHQTGLAMDVSCASIGNKLIEEFVDTPEGKWLYEHCWEYGFIIRYPKDKTKITGYAYEPWHVRYVGIPLAYYLTTTGLTLEEYYNVCDPYDDEYLNTHPLIDTSTPKYHSLYASAKYGQLIKFEDGTAWVNKSTGYPYLLPALRDAKKNLVKDSKKKLIYLEPLQNMFGEYYLDKKGNIITKAYFKDTDGNPVFDANGKLVYLKPLVEGDGSFVRDADNNIVYRPLLTDSQGNIWLDSDGLPYQLVPLRDEVTYLCYDSDGTVIYYPPFQDPDHYGEGGQADYLLDENNNLRFSEFYYSEGLPMEENIAILESGVYPSNN